MKRKVFKLLFYFSFLSCSGCDEEEEQSDPIIQPSIIEITIFPSISYEQANDPNFWKQYTIDQDSYIFPIIEKIKSDKWQDEKFKKFFIALTAFLSVKSNVSTLNKYKNRTTFGKILFFVALAISDGENISKYETFFYEELIRRLQKSHPEDWENILENPLKLEQALNDIIIDDTLDKNPESEGKIGKYQTVKGVHGLPILRHFVYVPKVTTFCQDKIFHNTCWMIKNNKKLQEELLRLRKEYLITKQKPNIDTFLISMIKEQLRQKLEIPENSDEIIEKKLEEMVEELVKNNLYGDINEKIIKMIEEGGVKFYFCEGGVPQLSDGEDRYFIKADDGGYHRTFGNEKLANVVCCYIDFDLDKDDNNFIIDSFGSIFYGK